MIKIILPATAAVLLLGSFASYTESAAPESPATVQSPLTSTVTTALPVTEAAEKPFATSLAVVTPAPVVVAKTSGSTVGGSFNNTATAPAPSVPAAGVAQAETVVATPAPATVVAPTPAPEPVASVVTTPGIPSRLNIPSIGLDQRIIPVGLTAAGAMDVPNGNTLDVGWLKTGIVPGNTGSAVLDAHVFAAFSKLKHLSVGESIYVKDENGQTMRFVVRSMTTYLLSDMDLAVRKFIFNKADGKFLNLITCAGTLTADHSTYTHRLVIHAELAQ